MHEPCVDRRVQPRSADGEERHDEDDRLGHPRRREYRPPRRAHVLADVAAEVSKRHRLSVGKVRLDRLPLAQQEEAEGDVAAHRDEAGKHEVAQHERGDHAASDSLLEVRSPRAPRSKITPNQKAA